MVLRTFLGEHPHGETNERITAEYREKKGLVKKVLSDSPLENRQTLSSELGGSVGVEPQDGQIRMIILLSTHSFH